MIDTEVRFVRIERAKQQAQRELNRGKKLELNIHEKSFSQPLGKITSQASEFNKSLEASNARVLAFGASVGVMNAVGEAFASLVTTSIEFKKTMQDINVILGVSESTLSKFGSQLFKVAQNTAQSFDVAAEAALEFSRQGLNLSEVLERTNSALMLTRITSLDAATAVKGLTAAVNGFADAGLTTAEIVDKLSAVDVRFAVSSEDLINALSRSAAVAQDAGVSFDELIGTVTAAQQITARGGQVIGNSFKTIFTRLNRTTTIDALGELGIAVKDAQGNTLPAIKIMDELAKTYDSLGASTKSAVAEQVGGVFQINILKAVMKDLSREQSIAQKATLASADAFGEASIKNEQLNKTISSMASQTGTELQKLSAIVGGLVLDAPIKRILENVKGGSELLTNLFGGQDSGEEQGFNIGKGILKGISNVLSGPGIAIAIGVIGKLFVNLAKFSKEAFQDFSGITSKAHEQKKVEESINQLLDSDTDLKKELLSLGTNRLKQEEKLLQVIREQTKLVQTQKNLSKNLAPSLMRRGLQSDLTLKTKSSGQIPNFSRENEAKEASKKYGQNIGIEDTYQTTITRNNKKEEVIVNNQEKIITQKELSKQGIQADGDMILPPENTQVGKQRRKEFNRKLKGENFLNDNIEQFSGNVPNFAMHYVYAKELSRSARARLDSKTENVGRRQPHDVVGANIVIEKLKPEANKQNLSPKAHRDLAKKFWWNISSGRDPYVNPELREYKSIFDSVYNPKGNSRKIDFNAFDDISKFISQKNDPEHAAMVDELAISRIQGAFFEAVVERELKKTRVYQAGRGNQPMDGVEFTDRNMKNVKGFVEIKSQKRTSIKDIISKVFHNYLYGNPKSTFKNLESETIMIPGEHKFIIPENGAVVFDNKGSFRAKMNKAANRREKVEANNNLNKTYDKLYKNKRKGTSNPVGQYNIDPYYNGLIPNFSENLSFSNISEQAEEIKRKKLKERYSKLKYHHTRGVELHRAENRSSKQKFREEGVSPKPANIPKILYKPFLQDSVKTPEDVSNLVVDFIRNHMDGSMGVVSQVSNEGYEPGGTKVLPELFSDNWEHHETPYHQDVLNQFGKSSGAVSMTYDYNAAIDFLNKDHGEILTHYVPKKNILNTNKIKRILSKGAFTNEKGQKVYPMVHKLKENLKNGKLSERTKEIGGLFFDANELYDLPASSSYESVSVLASEAEVTRLFNRGLIPNFVKDSRIARFMIGPPAVGKSTWLKKNHPNSFVISRDDIVNEVAGEIGLTYDDLFASPDKNLPIGHIDPKYGKVIARPDNAPKFLPDTIWDKVFQANGEVHKRFMGKFKSAADSGQDVAVDMTLLNKGARAGMMKNFSEYKDNFDFEAVDFNFQGEEESIKKIAKARAEEIKKAGGSKTIPDAVMDRMFSSYEAPSLDEGFKKIYNVDDRKRIASMGEGIPSFANNTLYRWQGAPDREPEKAILKKPAYHKSLLSPLLKAKDPERFVDLFTKFMHAHVAGALSPTYSQRKDWSEYKLDPEKIKKGWEELDNPYTLKGLNQNGEKSSGLVSWSKDEIAIQPFKRKSPWGRQYSRSVPESNIFDKNSLLSYLIGGGKDAFGRYKNMKKLKSALKNRNGKGINTLNDEFFFDFEKEYDNPNFPKAKAFKKEKELIQFLSQGFVPNFAKKSKYKFPKISLNKMEKNISNDFEKLSLQDQQYFSRAYEDYNNIIGVFSKATGTSSEKFANVMSALSPTNPLERNALDALRYILYAKKRLSEMDSETSLSKSDKVIEDIASVSSQTYPANRVKAANIILDREELTGNKRKAFLNNMLDPFSSEDVTVDYRAQQVALGNKKITAHNAPAMNRGQYDKVSQAFRNVGIRAGVSGLGVQAATWVGERIGTPQSKGQDFNRGIIKFFYDNPDKINLETLNFLLSVPEGKKDKIKFLEKASEMGVSKLSSDNLISIARADGYIPSFADSVVNTNEILLKKGNAEAVIPGKEAKDLNIKEARRQGFEVRSPRGQSVHGSIANLEKQGAIKHGYTPGRVVPYTTLGAESGETPKEFMKKRGLFLSDGFIPNFADYYVNPSNLTEVQIQKLLKSEKFSGGSEFNIYQNDDQYQALIRRKTVKAPTEGQKSKDFFDDLMKIRGKGHRLIFMSKQKSIGTQIEDHDKTNKQGKLSKTKILLNESDKISFIQDDENPSTEANLAKHILNKDISIKTIKGNSLKEEVVNKPNVISDANVFQFASSFDPPLQDEIEQINKSKASLKVIKIKENLKDKNKIQGTPLSFIDKKNILQQSLKKSEGTEIQYLNAAAAISKNYTQKDGNLINIGDEVEQSPINRKFVQDQIRQGDFDAIKNMLPSVLRNQGYFDAMRIRTSQLDNAQEDKNSFAQNAGLSSIFDNNTNFSNPASIAPSIQSDFFGDFEEAENAAKAKIIEDRIKRKLGESKIRQQLIKDAIENQYLKRVAERAKRPQNSGLEELDKKAVRIEGSKKLAEQNVGQITEYSDIHDLLKIEKLLKNKNVNLDRFENSIIDLSRIYGFNKNLDLVELKKLDKQNTPESRKKIEELRKKVIEGEYFASVFTATPTTKDGKKLSDEEFKEVDKTFDSKIKREILGLEVPKGFVGARSSSGAIRKMIAFNSGIEYKRLNEKEKQRLKEVIEAEDTFDDQGKIQTKIFKLDNGEERELKTKMSVGNLQKWQMEHENDENPKENSHANRYSATTRMFQVLKSVGAMKKGKDPLAYYGGAEKVLEARRHNEKEIAALYPEVFSNPKFFTGFLNEHLGSSWMVDFWGTGLNQSVIPDASDFRKNLNASLSSIVFNTANDLFNLPDIAHNLGKSLNVLKDAFEKNIESTQAPVMIGNMFDIITKSLTKDALKPLTKEQLNRRIDIPNITDAIRKIIDVPSGVKQLEVKGSPSEVSNTSMAKKILTERGIIAESSKHSDWSPGENFKNITLQQFEDESYLEPIDLNKTTFRTKENALPDLLEEIPNAAIQKNQANKQKEFKYYETLSSEEEKQRNKNLKLAMGKKLDTEDRLIKSKSGIIGLFPDLAGTKWHRGFVKKGSTDVAVDFIGTSFKSGEYYGTKEDDFQNKVMFHVLEEMMNISRHHKISQGLTDLGSKNPEKEFKKRLKNSIEPTQSPVFSGNVLDIIVKTIAAGGIAKGDINDVIDIRHVTPGLRNIIDLPEGHPDNYMLEVKNSRTQENLNKIAHKILAEEGHLEKNEKTGKFPAMNPWTPGVDTEIKMLEAFPFPGMSQDDIEEQKHKIQKEGGKLVIEGHSNAEKDLAEQFSLASRMYANSVDDYGNKFPEYLEKRIYNDLVGDFPSRNPESRNVLEMVAKTVAAQARAARPIGGEMFEILDDNFTLRMAKTFNDYRNGISLRDSLTKSLSTIMSEADMSTSVEAEKQKQENKLKAWEALEKKAIDDFIANRDPADANKPTYIPEDKKRKIISEASKGDKNITDILEQEHDSLIVPHYKTGNYEEAIFALQEDITKRYRMRDGEPKEGTLDYLDIEMRRKKIEELQEKQKKQAEKGKSDDFDRNKKLSIDSLSKTLQSFGLSTDINDVNAGNKIRFTIGDSTLEANVDKNGRIDMDSLKSSVAGSLTFEDRMKGVQAMHDKNLGQLELNESGQVKVTQSLIEELKRKYKEDRLTYASELYKNKDVAKVMSSLAALGKNAPIELQEAFIAQTGSGDISKIGKKDFYDSTYLKGYSYKPELDKIKERGKRSRINYGKELNKLFSSKEKRFGFIPNFAATYTGSSALRVSSQVAGGREAINREINALTSRGLSQKQALDNTQITIRNNGFIPNFSGDPPALVTNIFDEGRVSPTNVHRSIQKVHGITRNHPKFSTMGMNSRGFVPNFADENPLFKAIKEQVAGTGGEKLSKVLEKLLDKLLKTGKGFDEFVKTLQKAGIGVEESGIKDELNKVKDTFNNLNDRAADILADEKSQAETLPEAYKQAREEIISQLSGRDYNEGNVYGLSIKGGQITERSLEGKMRLNNKDEDFNKDLMKSSLSQDDQSELQKIRNEVTRKDLSVKQTIEEVKKLNLSKKQTKEALTMLSLKKQEVKASQKYISSLKEKDRMNALGTGLQTAMFAIPMGMGILQESMFGDKKRYELSKRERMAQGAMEGFNTGTMLASLGDMLPVGKFKNAFQLLSLAIPTLTGAIKKSALTFKDLSEKAQDGAEHLREDLTAFSEYAELSKRQKEMSGQLSPLQNKELEIQKARTMSQISDPEILKKFDAAAGNDTKIQEIKLDLMKREAQKSLLSQTFIRSQKHEDLFGKVARGKASEKDRLDFELESARLGNNIGGVIASGMDSSNVDKVLSALGNLEDFDVKNKKNLYLANLSEGGIDQLKNKNLYDTANKYAVVGAGIGSVAGTYLGATGGTVAGFGVGSGATGAAGAYAGMKTGGLVGAGIGYGVGLGRGFIKNMTLDKDIQAAKDLLSKNLEENKGQFLKQLEDAGVIDKSTRLDLLGTPFTQEIQNALKDMLKSQAKSISGSNVDNILSVNYKLASDLLKKKLTEQIQASESKIALKKGDMKISEMIFSPSQERHGRLLGAKSFASVQKQFDLKTLDQNFEIEREAWINSKSESLRGNLDGVFKNLGMEGISFNEQSVEKFRENPQEMLDSLSSLFDVAVDKTGIRESSGKLKKATVEYSDSLVDLLVNSKEKTIEIYQDAINGNIKKYMNIGEDLSKMTKDELRQRIKTTQEDIETLRSSGTSENKSQIIASELGKIDNVNKMGEFINELKNEIQNMNQNYMIEKNIIEMRSKIIEAERSNLELQKQLTTERENFSFSIDQKFKTGFNYESIIKRTPELEEKRSAVRNAEQKLLEKQAQSSSHEEKKSAAKKRIQEIEERSFESENKHIEKLKSDLKKVKEEKTSFLEKRPTHGIVNYESVLQSFKDERDAEINKILNKRVKAGKKINEGKVTKELKEVKEEYDKKIQLLNDSQKILLDNAKLSNAMTSSGVVMNADGSFSATTRSVGRGFAESEANDRERKKIQKEREKLRNEIDELEDKDRFREELGHDKVERESIRLKKERIAELDDKEKQLNTYGISREIKFSGVEDMHSQLSRTRNHRFTNTALEEKEASERDDSSYQKNIEDVSRALNEAKDTLKKNIEKQNEELRKAKEDLEKMDQGSEDYKKQISKFSNSLFTLKDNVEKSINVIFNTRTLAIEEHSNKILERMKVEKGNTENPFDVNSLYGQQFALQDKKNNLELNSRFMSRTEALNQSSDIKREELELQIKEERSGIIGEFSSKFLEEMDKLKIDTSFLENMKKLSEDKSYSNMGQLKRDSQNEITRLQGEIATIRADLKRADVDKGKTASGKSIEDTKTMMEVKQEELSSQQQNLQKLNNFNDITGIDLIDLEGLPRIISDKIDSFKRSVEELQLSNLSDEEYIKQVKGLQGQANSMIRELSSKGMGGESLSGLEGFIDSVLKALEQNAGNVTKRRADLEQSIHLSKSKNKSEIDFETINKDFINFISDLEKSGEIFDEVSSQYKQVTDSLGNAILNAIAFQNEEARGIKQKTANANYALQNQLDVNALNDLKLNAGTFSDRQEEYRLISKIAERGVIATPNEPKSLEEGKVIYDAKKISPEEQARVKALSNVGSNLTSLNQSQYDSVAKINYAQDTNNFVGAAKATTEYYEIQKQLNEELGKGTQFADQYMVSLARIREEIENFDANLAGSMVSGLNSGLKDAMKNAFDPRSRERDKENGIGVAEGMLGRTLGGVLNAVSDTYINQAANQMTEAISGLFGMSVDDPKTVQVEGINNALESVDAQLLSFRSGLEMAATAAANLAIALQGTVQTPAATTPVVAATTPAAVIPAAPATAAPQGWFEKAGNFFSDAFNGIKGWFTKGNAAGGMNEHLINQAIIREKEQIRTLPEYRNHRSAKPTIVKNFGPQNETIVANDREYIDTKLGMVLNPKQRQQLNFASGKEPDVINIDPADLKRLNSAGTHIGGGYSSLSGRALATNRLIQQYGSDIVRLQDHKNAEMSRKTEEKKNFWESAVVAPIQGIVGGTVVSAMTEPISAIGKGGKYFFSSSKFGKGEYVDEFNNGKIVSTLGGEKVRFNNGGLEVYQHRKSYGRDEMGNKNFKWEEKASIFAGETSLALGNISQKIIDQVNPDTVRNNMNFGQDISDFRISEDPMKQLATGTSAILKNNRFAQGHKDFKITRDPNKNVEGARDEFHVKNFANGLTTGRSVIDQVNPDVVRSNMNFGQDISDFEIAKDPMKQLATGTSAINFSKGGRLGSNARNLSLKEQQDNLRNGIKTLANGNITHIRNLSTGISNSQNYVDRNKIENINKNINAQLNKSNNIESTNNVSGNNNKDSEKNVENKSNNENNTTNNVQFHITINNDGQVTGTSTSGDTINDMTQKELMEKLEKAVVGVLVNKMDRPGGELDF